jgi:hypothetical protein
MRLSVDVQRVNASDSIAVVTPRSIVPSVAPALIVAPGSVRGMTGLRASMIARDVSARRRESASTDRATAM